MKKIERRVTGMLLALVIMLGIFTSGTMTAEAAGNSFSEATSINLGSTYYGEITSSNKIDYYKFTLSKSGSINFTYSGPTGGIYLSLYNSDYSEIENHPINYTSYTFDLTSGTYYLKFRYSYNYGAYNFKMTFTSANESFSEAQGGSNNTTATASNISTGNTYYGQIAQNDTIDYYKFTLSKSGSINFTYSGPTGGIYLSLYNSDYSEIENHPINYTSYTFDLTSGTYYLKFRYSYNYGAYNFKMTFTSANESFSEAQGGSNNTTATASNISTGNTYYGQIAQNDTIDYYKFTLSKSGSINFTYSGPTGGIYLSLYNSDYSEIENHPISYTSYTFDLTSGTYYLKFRYSYNYGAYSFTLTIPDTTNPTGSISSTNSVATSQTATLYLYDNVGVAGYYWGTSSSYSSNSYSSVSSAPTSTSVTKTISSSGTYYLTVKDTAGNVSTTYSITYYKTTLNANGGSVSPSYVITKSGSSFTFPTPTKSGYEYKGWSTSSTATSGSYSLSPSSNNTYYAVWKVPVVLSSISIYSSPNKTTYYTGDTLNTTGLKIKLSYSDGSYSNISSGFTLSTPDMNKLGTQSITVTYQGKTTTFTITVLCPHNNTTVTGVIEATCGNTGYTGDTYCLDCGAKITTGSIITKPNHNWNSWIVTKEPTCTQKGVETRVCANDNTHIETRNISALGHDYKAVVTEPTCTKQGYTTYTCTRCGNIYIDNYISALGHTGGMATCHSKAVCTRCGNEYGDFDANNHDGETEVRNAKASTCTVAGYTGDTYCLSCGAKIATGEVIAKLGHSFTNYISNNDATCTADGTKTAKCDRCNATATITDTGSKLGHDYVGVATEPTCTKQGYTTHTCTRCGNIYIDNYISALGHTGGTATCHSKAVCTRCGNEYGDFDANNHDGETEVRNAKASTCTVAGYTGDTYCLGCGAKIATGETIVALGHNYKAVVTDPTCTEQGYTTYTCTRCGNIHIDNYISALGHTGGTATCHSKAVCTRCGNEYGDFDANNHDGETEVRNAKASTCTVAGYTGDTYCLSCGAKIATGEVIAKLGHSFTNYISNNDATCTADGTKTAKCDRCDATDTVTDTGSKLGHDYVGVATEPTCTKQGYTIYTCSRCGDSYVNNYTNALGHTVGEWLNDENNHWHICTACGEKIDEAEHTVSDWIIDLEPTIYANGEEHKECTVCGRILENETILDLHTPGDINGDDKVNNKDLTRLFQHLSGWDVTVNEAALDINGDGKVNNKDLTRLFQYLSGWAVEIY